MRTPPRDDHPHSTAAQRPGTFEAGRRSSTPHPARCGRSHLVTTGGHHGLVTSQDFRLTAR